MQQLKTDYGCHKAASREIVQHAAKLEHRPAGVNRPSTVDRRRPRPHCRISQQSPAKGKKGLETQAEGPSVDRGGLLAGNLSCAVAPA